MLKINAATEAAMEVSGDEVSVCVNTNNEVVGNSFAFLISDSIGEDVKAFVDLHFVRVDNLTEQVHG